MKQGKYVEWHRLDAFSLNVKSRQATIAGSAGGSVSHHLVARSASGIMVKQTCVAARISKIKFIQTDRSLMRQAQRVAGLPARKLAMMIFTTGIFAASQRQETAERIERDLVVRDSKWRVSLHVIAPALSTQPFMPGFSARTPLLSRPAAAAMSSVRTR